MITEFSTRVACGFANFIFCETTKKIFISGSDPTDRVPRTSKEIDAYFKNFVVIQPLFEEILARGILQPLLSKQLVPYIPELLLSSTLNIPSANLVSLLAISIGLGTLRYGRYEDNGPQLAIIESIRQSIHGLVKERFGLVASITEHMIDHFFIANKAVLNEHS